MIDFSGNCFDLGFGVVTRITCWFHPPELSGNRTKWFKGNKRISFTLGLISGGQNEKRNKKSEESNLWPQLVKWDARLNGAI